MGFDEIMFAFFTAILSFCVFCLAWGMFFMKARVLSAVLSLLNIVLVVFSAKGWLSALVNSGKNTEALGFRQYPIVPISYGVLLLGSLVCIILSFILLRQKREQAREGEEAAEEE